ncbi:hypothetical protein OAQ27_01445 [Aquiluna sp.]|nr:hypothetical protein [Aquiluna sp.]
MQKLNVLAFSFEELNSMALLQGVIHNSRKQDSRSFWLCLVPPGFKSLAFAADFVMEYPENLLLYDSYNQVAEFTDYKWSKTRRLLYDLKRSIGSTGLERWQRKDSSRKFWAAVSASPRATKYFWSNVALQRWISDLGHTLSTSYEEVELWPVNDLLFMGQDKLEYRKVSLGESFRERFGVLEMAIRDGLVFHPSSESLPSIQKPFDKPDVLIRSRNYTNKQKVHNSSATNLRALLKELLDKGLIVVQSGVPAVPMLLTHENYLEVSELTLDAEIALLHDRSTVLYTEGGAGLFSLMACLANKVEILSPEWSVENYAPPISLLQSRKIRDLR